MGNIHPKNPAKITLICGIPCYVYSLLLRIIIPAYPSKSCSCIGFMLYVYKIFEKLGYTFITITE